MRDLKQPKVLEHLQKYGSITQLEAFQKYRSMRLSGIIYRLKHDGYNIVTVLETDKDSGAQYARYMYHGKVGEINA